MNTNKSDEYKNCPICVCNRLVISWVTCPKCSFSCCMGCTKKYLLDLKDINPKCMSCSTQWDFEFVAENTDKGFHNNQYRDVRAKLIMDRERSLLPGTQPLVVQAKLEKDLRNELEDVNNAIKKVENFLRDARARKIVLRTQLANIQQTGQVVEQKAGHFIGHCPVEDCKGYLDTSYKCGICNEKACKRCRQSEHTDECDKDTVETVKLLAKDTKPCPSCSIPIFKISGCSQMFCLGCKTAFDWNTGKIETGVIHNPHYYAWQRDQNGGQVPRRAGEVRCGGPVNVSLLASRMREVDVEPSIVDWVLRGHETAQHIRHIVLLQYTNTDVGVGNNQDLRVKYLLGDLPEKKWQSELKKREKKREKDRAIHLVLRMLCDTIDDLTNNIVDCNTTEVPMILIQMSELRKYVNKSLKKIAKRFDNKVPTIDGKWIITNERISPREKHRRAYTIVDRLTIQ